MCRQGQPLMLDCCLQAFAQLVGVERRMVHENDIVPSVPTFTGRCEGSTSTC